MRNKAQVSVEFLIVLIAVTLILLASVFIFSEKNSGFILSKENSEARLAAKKVSRAVNEVFLDGNGTTSLVALERSFDYEIACSGNAVQVKWKSNFVDSPMLTDSVTLNSLELGELVKVSNVGGVVIVENA